MDEKEMCISQYRKLLGLLEEDLVEIERGLQGDLLDEYREIIIQEIGILSKNLRAIQTML